MYLLKLQFYLGICPDVGLLDHMATLFKFSEWMHTIFHSGCISLQTHQQETTLTLKLFHHFGTEGMSPLVVQSFHGDICLSQKMLCNAVTSE